ncbi:MAG: hypothetical protein M1837_004521 [Sclerophora amabilis]|nr:MAG: hypothetical protein M1837_004521 [Sclerophora amabilis]
MSTQTPQRSLFRKRPVLGTISAASSPDLAATFATQQNLNQQARTTPGGGGGGGSGRVARETIARKASLNQLTSNSLSTLSDRTAGHGLPSVKDEEPASPDMAPVTPAGRTTTGGGPEGEIEVGDSVDVPGGMHGTVKFIGKVKEKAGVFAGVELSREFAARGKNDGDVEGTRYFSTTIPNSGIFLPVNRAAKRASPTISAGSFPPTPSTPSFAGFNIGAGQLDRQGAASNKTFTPPPTSVNKFSQSVGQGRAPSPQLKPKSRPSLPRPESPSRKLGISGRPESPSRRLATPAARPSLGAPASSKNGAAGGPRYAPSPTPGKFGAGLRERRASANADPGKRVGYTPRPGMRTPSASRTASALSMRSDFDEGDAESTPVGNSRPNTGPAARTSSGSANEQLETLRRDLALRDRQLKDQSTSLAEMEKSFAELQSLLPSNGHAVVTNSNRGSGSSDADVSQLRNLLREKNEKISLLTAEFDAHRADFRSTIDTLEMASTETERVYEKRIEDLLQEVRDLQDRGEDVESVARQLKQLEELVQELEEGLEDARRGEAEARGEVEFLRGEVERGRSELRRERDKAAAALKGAGAAFDSGSSPGGSKEVEQRDDEIRGLKAIIHSLSRDSVPDMGSPVTDSAGKPKSQRHNSFNKTNGSGKRSSMQLAEERIVREKLEREVKELQGLVERKAFKEEELEREIDRLRGGGTPGRRDSGGVLGRNSLSEKTVTPSRRSSSARDSKGTVVSWPDRPPGTYRHAPLATMPESDHYPSDSDDRGLWCEICETSGHDILTCTNMFGNQQTPSQPEKKGSSGTTKADLSPPSAGKRTGRDAVAEGLYNQSPLSLRTEDKVEPLSAAKRSPVPEQTTPRPTPAVRMPHPMESGMVAGKASGVIDPNKWCALCERDGHESVDCPFEDAF